MKVFNLLSKSRGTRNLFSRVVSTFRRFGISPNKFVYLLDIYNKSALKLGYRPTFAITAAILNRYPNFIKELALQGIEFAVHGYFHVDYTTISYDEQDKHFRKAIEAFKTCEIPYVGFRAPFLRINGYTPRVLETLGFMYDSSLSVKWDVIDLGKHLRSIGEYNRLIDFYRPRNAEQYLSLPRNKGGLIEIPVSIPDDELMVDRLGITSTNEIGNVWKAILEQTYNRGELFTLQLHPERIIYCESALVDVISQAKNLNPPVWIVTLQEICAWWKEREKFVFNIFDQGDGKYRVKANCSERATLLVKNSKVNVPVSEGFDGYQCIKARDFVIESPKRPVIGVKQNSSSIAVDFLRNEGFVVERSDQSDDYGIYLDKLTEFTEFDEKTLYDEINCSNAPLLRYWRWPDQNKSALSITGDIDSMTLIDFLLRIYENWRQKKI
jgi:peptidoglycan/xylan/chitin deacetylase (PgdA/CDA1 family)